MTIRRYARIAASISFWLSGSFACNATVDGYATILMPLEQMQVEGFCERKVLAHDGVSSSLFHGVELIGIALSNPYPIASNMPLTNSSDAVQSKSINSNPIADGLPKITVVTDAGGGDTEVCAPEINIAVTLSEPIDKRIAERLNTRLKLALVFALRNIFAISEGAKIRVRIAGLPDQSGASGVKLFAKPQYPYTERSPHYLALVKELAGEECFHGRSIKAVVPKLWSSIERCPQQ